MDSNGTFESTHDLPRDSPDLVRHCAAVRVAEDEKVGTCGIRGGQRAERILRVFFVTVEKMFGVVKNLPAIFFQKSHGVRDHSEILLCGNSEDLGDVEQPGLSNNRDDWGARLEERAHLRVGFHGDPAAAGAAECGNFGVFPRKLCRFSKKCDVAGV